MKQLALEGVMKGLQELLGQEVVVKRGTKRYLQGKLEIYPRFVLIRGQWNETFLYGDLLRGEYVIKAADDDGDDGQNLS